LKGISKSRNRKNSQRRYATFLKGKPLWQAEKSGYWPERKVVVSGVRQNLKLLVILALAITTFAVPYGVGVFNQKGTLASLPCAANTYFPIGTPCQDPSALVWQRLSNQPGNLNDWNISPGQRQTYVANCDLIGAGNDCISLDAFSGNNSVAITKRPVGDLSVGNGKTLNLSAGYILSGTTSFGSANDWGFFITTNSTAPAHAIGSTGVYNAFNDPNVLLFVEVFCTNAGGCGGAGTSYTTTIYLLKHLGNGESIGSEDSGCNSGGSCLVQLTGAGPSGCAANPCQGNNIANVLGFYANYTGPSTNTSGCSIAANVFVGPSCSWVFDFIGATGALVYGRDAQGAQAIPANPFTGAGPYYLGLFSRVPGIQVEFSFSVGDIPAAGGNNGMDIFTFVPAPTASVKPPQFDSSNFLGSVWTLVVGGYSQLCTALSIQSFCSSVYNTVTSAANDFASAITQALVAAPSLIISVLAFYESLYQALFNAVGNAFGFPTLGDDIFSLINQFITFFGPSTFGVAFNQIANLFLYFFDRITIINSWIGIFLAILSAIFGVLTPSISFIVTIVVDFFLVWTTSFILAGCLLFIIYAGDSGLSGIQAWWDTMKWLAFGTGISFLIDVLNFGFDVILTVIGLIPKPFIQIAASKVPRIPNFGVSGNPSWPNFEMQSAKDGNIFSFLMMGLGTIFFAWAETNPLIPGSIAFFVPAVTVTAQNANKIIVAMLLPVAVLGGASLFFLFPATLTKFFEGITTGRPSISHGPSIVSSGVSIGRREGRRPKFLVRKLEEKKERLTGIRKEQKLERKRQRAMVEETQRVNREAEARGLTQKAEVERLKREEKLRQVAREVERQRREAESRIQVSDAGSSRQRQEREGGEA
jgi:hypothetical protein